MDFSAMNNDMNWANWQNSIRDPNAPERTTENELDREAFLRLLVTQLQFQDPMNPMEDHAFVAQLAQFSALEQMQNINNNTIRSHAFAMVGREVVAEVRNEATGNMDLVAGRVSSAVIENGQAFVVVENGSAEGRKVAMTDVVYVGNNMDSELLANMNTILLASQNMSIVGQYAQFVEQDADGNITSFIEGRIDSLRFDRDRGLLLTVGGREVTASQVLEISSRQMIIGNPISGVTIAEPGEQPTTVTNATINAITINTATGGGFILETSQGRVLVSDINDLTSAMRHVGTFFDNGTDKGMVTSIEMRAGIPQLVLDNGTTVAFTRGDGTNSLIDRNISFAATAAAEPINGRITAVTRDGESGHNLTVAVGNDSHTVFVRDISRLNQAIGNVGRSFEGENITNIRLLNGEPHFVLSSGETVLFANQSTAEAV
ncbi:MAG: hypothetical protein FWF57_09345 [Defluviitaleaceae bacterium]|nr:hypothetical protein [Defluviitaleaceae bacterium]